MSSKLAPDSPQEGRRARRRRETRAKLLQAAHIVMSRVGVESATIKEITQQADVGFGTVYSYFETKEKLASALLDCMIHDVVRRNFDVTEDLTHTAPETVAAVRNRMFVRTGMNDPLWCWWSKHPEQLFDRLDRGISPYAKPDIRISITNGELELAQEDVDFAWRMALWVVVGGIHDVAVHGASTNEDVRVTEAVLRLIGMPPAKAQAYAAIELPEMPPSEIDWDFAIGES